MSDLFTAAENVRKFAKQFEGILAVADVLENIGKLEQITQEQQAQADAARKATEQAKADLAKIKEQVKFQAAKGDALVTDATVAAAKQADEIVADATARAGSIVVKARDEAVSIAAKLAADRATANAELSAIQQEIERARADLVAANEQRDAALAATADAEKKLEGIKGKLKSLLA